MQLLSAMSQCISESQTTKANGVSGDMYRGVPPGTMNGSPQSNISPLSLLADVASMDSENNLDSKKSLSKMKQVLELMQSVLCLWKVSECLENQLFFYQVTCRA